MPGCTMRDGCKCRFEVHAQRLDESAWLKVVDDMRHDRPVRAQPALPRNPISHAPRIDGAKPAPAQISRWVAEVSAPATLLVVALTLWLAYLTLA